MASQHPHSSESSPEAAIGVSEQLFFAGDGVRLAGQVDYPNSPATNRGYPLIFIIQHATCTSRQGYAHVAKFGAAVGMAVFRWDKRGTGASGADSNGSVAVDTVQAYKTAISQSLVDRNRVVILAQNEGAILLSEAFADFAAIQQPRGVLLMGNMLDETQILSIKAPVHIVMSKNDWNAWQIYGQAASETHSKRYGWQSTYYVAPNTNRRLMYTNGGTFHRGAEDNIKEWLKTICQISI